MAINWNNVEPENNSSQITALETALKDGKIAGYEDWTLGKLSNSWDSLVETYGSPEKAAEIGLKLAKNDELAQIEGYLSSKGVELEAKDFAGELSKLESAGQLDNFLARLANDPDYKTQLAETLENNPSAANAIIAQHGATPPQQTAGNTSEASDIPVHIRRPDETAPAPTDTPNILDGITDVLSAPPQEQAPQVTVPYRAEPATAEAPSTATQQQRPTPTSNQPQPSPEDIEAMMEIGKFMAEHEAANPQDAALVAHFMDGVQNDPKLQESLKAFKANNGDLLKGGDGDDMMAGFMNKDAMIHDLLDSYKKTPDKAYEALANPDFQTEAFMQYSSIGQAVSMIAKPILEWIGGLFGQDGSLDSWAQMDFGSMMKDFQAFFNGGMNNAIGMSNNGMGFVDSLSTVFSVGGGALKDTLDTNIHERGYMNHHKPDQPANKVTIVDGDTNTITGELTLGAPPQSAAEIAAEEQKRQAALQQSNAQNPSSPSMDAPGAAG